MYTTLLFIECNFFFKLTNLDGVDFGDLGCKITTEGYLQPQY